MTGERKRSLASGVRPVEEASDRRERIRWQKSISGTLAEENRFPGTSSHEILRMFRKEKSVITAVDFLHMYLEFNTMTPAKKDWTKQKLAKSPPWLNRLLRLESLIEALRTS